MSYKYFVKMLLFLQAFIISSCFCDGIKERIPKEFINDVIQNKEDYKKDSIEITKQMEDFLERHENFFYSKEYCDSTQLIIDSIIYSPDFNKLAIFLITKNPTNRQLVPDKKHQWYYNANCYLGIRQEDVIILSSIGPSFSNSSDKDKLKKMIRDTYFSKYAKIKDSNGLFRYKYNIGDIRFWDCPIWQEIEEEKQKKEEFDDYKKNHPENIFKPNIR